MKAMEDKTYYGDGKLSVQPCPKVWDTPQWIVGFHPGEAMPEPYWQAIRAWVNDMNESGDESTVLTWEMGYASVILANERNALYAIMRFA